MKQIRIGEMNQVITLKRLVKASDQAGGTTSTLEDVRELWGKVRTLSAHERMILAQTGQVVTHDVHLRWSDDYLTFGSTRAELTKTHILIFSGRQLRIEYVVNLDEADWVLHLRCAEETPGGE